MYFATPKTMGWIEKLKQESKKNGTVGCVVLDKLGNIAMPYNSGGMFRGFLYKEKGSPEIKKGCGIGKKIVVVGEK